MLDEQHNVESRVDINCSPKKSVPDEILKRSVHTQLKKRSRNYCTLLRRLTLFANKSIFLHMFLIFD